MARKNDAQKQETAGAIDLASLSDNQLLTYTQAATVLQVEPQHVRRLVSQGEIAKVDLGHRTKRIRAAALRKFILEREAA